MMSSSELGSTYQVPAIEAAAPTTLSLPTDQVNFSSHISQIKVTEYKNNGKHGEMHRSSRVLHTPILNKIK
jgi:hypothetical protein